MIPFGITDIYAPGVHMNEFCLSKKTAIKKTELN